MEYLKLIMNKASRVSESSILKSIRHGLVYAMPLILIGSMSLMILNLPVPIFQNFMDFIFGESWRDLFLEIYKGTFEIMSLVALLGISYSLIKSDQNIADNSISPLVPVLVVFGCYFCILPTTLEEILTVEIASATGLFRAIVVGICASKLFLWFYKHEKLQMKLITDDMDMVLAQTLSVLLPSFLTFFVAALLRVLTSYLGLDVSFNKLFYNFAGSFRNTKSMFGAAILFDVLSDVLWFFGLHGTNILEPFSRDVFVEASHVNATLFASGLPPTEIFTKQFFDIFVFLGGCGSTLCLTVALLLKAKKSNTSRLAKFSVFPALFNINEIMMYGLPVVLNPFFVVPFILTPVALAITTFLAMYFKLVPYTVTSVVWTTPIILGGYTTTKSVSGAILQVFNLFVGILVYMPFVTAYEKHKINLSRGVVQELIQAINYVKSDQSVSFLRRTDEIGFSARALARDIRASIYDNQNIMYLEYQPLSNEKGEVVGCEALLRWQHDRYGRIPPPVIVTLAEEAGLVNDLGDWIIRTAYREKAKWNEQGFNDIFLSVNLSPEQLKNPMLANVIKMASQATGVDPKEMEFELTENMAIEQSSQVKQTLMKIKKLGANLAMDDFGMGHSSLLYIKDFYIDAVKIDGTLVKDIVSDVNSQEIVSSIASLCNMLNLHIIAEFVETEEQRSILEKLGCNIYQGYLFSPSLSSENFLQYAKKHGIKKV